MKHAHLTESSTLVLRQRMQLLGSWMKLLKIKELLCILLPLACRATLNSGTCSETTWKCYWRRNLTMLQSASYQQRSHQDSHTGSLPCHMRSWQLLPTEYHWLADKHCPAVMAHFMLTVRVWQSLTQLDKAPCEQQLCHVEDCDDDRA